MKTVVNYAHRGASGYAPENTMAAFEKAIELGATGIETDVQMTKDGHLVLIHDEALDRTTNMEGYIRDYTLDELRQADAGSWYHQDYKGERIPLLENLFQLVKENNIRLNIELKNSIFPYAGMEEKVIELLKKHKLIHQVIISSFHHFSLVEVKKLAPEVDTGVLYIAPLYEPWNYARSLGASALHPHKNAVRKTWVEQAAQAGIIYNPFTVNEIEEMKSLIRAGVAGIITDYPDRLKTLIESE